MESTVANIGGLLALCGIASFRSFLPTFLLLAIARFAPGIEGCPQELLDVIAQVPRSMLGDGVLALFGVLAAAELAANWNDTMRQILEDADFDLYFKPFYAFVFAIVAGAPAQEAVSAAASAVPAAASSGVSSAAAAVSAAASAVPSTPAPEEGLPWLAWVCNIISSGAVGFGTWALCAFRARVASALRSVDPENTFHLHTLAKLAEETIWVALLLVALLVPLLAALLVVALMALAACFRGGLAAIERRTGHACAGCGGQVHNSAVVCPGCGKEQPLPYRRVGLFALASSRPVNAGDAADVARHHRRLLSAHRCPLCASRLSDGRVCGKCGAKVWEQGVTRLDLIRRLDGRMLGITAAGVALSVVPVFGFMVAAVAMNVMAIGVLLRYESRMGRIVGRFVFRVVKWTLLIAAIMLSAIPFMGALLLVPYVVRYLLLRRRFLAVPAPAAVA